MRLELQSALTAELTQANLQAMAFDGSYFYVPLPAERQVLKLDRQLGRVALIPVNRRFDLLYWDESEGVFWAASFEVVRTVYRLSPAFVLLKTVTLATNSCELEEIRSIGVNCRNGNLLITTASCVTEYEKTGAFVALRLRAGEGVTLNYVLTAAPYTLISYTKNGRGVLELTDRTGTNLGDLRVPRGLRLGALLFDPRSAQNRAAAYIAAWRGDTAMVFRQPLGVVPDSCNFDRGESGDNGCHLCSGVGGASDNGCHLCDCTGGAGDNGCHLCDCTDGAGDNGCHLCGDTGGEGENLPDCCRNAACAAEEILRAIGRINRALEALLCGVCPAAGSDDACDGGKEENPSGCRPKEDSCKACSLGGNSPNRLRELERLLLSQMQTVREPGRTADKREEENTCPAVIGEKRRNTEANDLVFVE